MFIPNYQLLFFKLTQLAPLSQKNLGKPRIRRWGDNPPLQAARYRRMHVVNLYLLCSAAHVLELFISLHIRSM